MSGYFGRRFLSFGQSTHLDGEVGRDDADRAGGLVAQVTQGIDLRFDLIEMGPILSSRRWPASVGDTARVVRVRRRTPSRASSWRMVWLSADCERPAFLAARVKLRSRATATNARRSFTLSRARHQAIPSMCADYIADKGLSPGRRFIALPSALFRRVRRGPSPAPGRSKIETSPVTCPRTTMPGCGTRPSR